MRLRGGFTPSVSAAERPGTSSARATAVRTKVSARIAQGLTALSRGGMAGAKNAADLHSAQHLVGTQRLRGGNSLRSMCRMASSSVSDTQGSTQVNSDAHVKLPVPACVTEGDEMAPQYDPSAVEEPLYKWCGALPCPSSA